MERDWILIFWFLGIESEQEDEEEDGPASRLVASILTFLLKGFTAKNKIPRYRSVQLVALLISSLGEIESVSFSLS